jgi:hypothetical protein
MKNLTLAMLLSATLSAQPADRARALEDYAFSTGLQAYVYGYPLVLLAATEPTYLSSQGIASRACGNAFMVMVFAITLFIDLSFSS